MGNLDYGAIGNCRSAALVSAKGSIDWLCFPDFDSPSVFAKILDKEKGGSLSFEVEAGCKISQQYKAHTNILSTLFETEEWAFEVVDFMPRYKIEDFNDHFLPPELYRLLRVKRGVPIEGMLRPKIKLREFGCGTQRRAQIHQIRRNQRRT